MAELTPTNYFAFDSTPFMQGLTSNPYSFEGQQQQQQSGGFGLNRYSIAPRKQNSYNQDLYSENRTAPVLDYHPTQSNVMPDQPLMLNVQDAHEVMDAMLPAMMPGDGGVGDATAIQQHQQAKQDVATIANSPNPDAVAKAILSQPQYGSGSFGGALMFSALQAMQPGSTAMDIAKAGIQGSEFFAEKDRKASTSDYLRQNVRQLLDSGYSPDSISAAITNGDNTLLKMRQLSPEQRRQQELEDQKAQNQEWRNRSDITQKNAIELKGIESADAMARQKQALDREAQRTSDAEAKAEQKRFENYNNDYRSRNTGFVRINNRQNTFANKANQWWEQYQEHIKNGDKQAAAADLKFASSELENSQIVGQRSTTPEEIQAATRIGGLWDQMITKANQLANGTLDESAAKAFGQTVRNAASMEHEVIENKSHNDYEAHRNAGWSPEQAADLVNRLRVSTTARSLPVKTYEEEYQKRQDPNYIPLSASAGNNDEDSKVQTGKKDSEKKQSVTTGSPDDWAATSLKNRLK
ncbi:hypothetical protein OGA32_000118 [Salmonella enterica]|nr:hypothetical protein [Salmonella enterica]